MLTLDKTPRLSLEKPATPVRHITSVDVYRNLIKQTRIVDQISAGFMSAAVDLSHDDNTQADIGKVVPEQYQLVQSFVLEFYHANYAALMQHYDSGLYFHWGWIGVGSDLFLTVAGHGAGFWEHETGKTLDVWCKQWHCETYAYGLDSDGEDSLGYDLETVEGYEIMLSRYH